MTLLYCLVVLKPCLIQDVLSNLFVACENYRKTNMLGDIAEFPLRLPGQQEWLTRKYLKLELYLSYRYYSLAYLKVGEKSQIFGTVRLQLESANLTDGLL